MRIGLLFCENHISVASSSPDSRLFLCHLLSLVPISAVISTLSHSLSRESNLLGVARLKRRLNNSEMQPFYRLEKILNRSEKIQFCYLYHNLQLCLAVFFGFKSFATHFECFGQNLVFALANYNAQAYMCVQM